MNTRQLLMSACVFSAVCACGQPRFTFVEESELPSAQPFETQLRLGEGRVLYGHALERLAVSSADPAIATAIQDEVYGEPNAWKYPCNPWGPTQPETQCLNKSADSVVKISTATDPAPAALLSRVWTRILTISHGTRFPAIDAIYKGATGATTAPTTWTSPSSEVISAYFAWFYDDTLPAPVMEAVTVLVQSAAIAGATALEQHRLVIFTLASAPTFLFTAPRTPMP